MSVNDLAMPEDSSLSPAFIEGAMSGQQDSATFEKRYRHRSGQIIHGQIASSLVRDVDGQPLYFISQVQDITARKQAEAELRQAQAEILRQAVERSQFEERERLLQDLHDGFGSQLTSARLRVEEGTLSQAELAELLRECMTDLHLVVDTMNSPGMMLAEALRHLRNRYRQRLAGRRPELSWELALDGCPPLGDRERLTLLRIIQEGLNNALKHANAGHIRIRAHQSGTDPLELRIVDDGVGFPEHLRPGKGLHHLRSRVQSLGGSLSLTRPDGHAGAALIIDIPLPAAHGSDLMETTRHA
jgi:signal transduction histidine kinase